MAQVSQIVTRPHVFNTGNISPICNGNDRQAAGSEDWKGHEYTLVENVSKPVTFLVLG
jgi:hypothetical protein